MFRIAQRLSDICASHVLAEKLVLAPSLAIGHQIADAIAHSGTPWVNLRIQTIRTLADAVAGFALATEGIALLSRAQALALIERACDRVLDSSSYFAALADRPGLHRAIQKSIDDLRHAGINPAEIKGASFEDARKAEDLAKILATYDEEMRAGGYVDRFGVLARATAILGAQDATAPHFEIVRSRPPSPLAQDHGVAAVSSGGDIPAGGEVRQRGDVPKGGDVPRPGGVPRLGMTPLPWGRDAIWLVVEDVELTAAEERFLKAAAGSWETVSLVGTAAAPKIAFRRAVGEENEVRGAFRAVLEDTSHFDDAEIVYTTRDTYLPLIYELTAEYEVPTTFAEGVASYFTRPGQACLAFLRWIGEGWHARELRVFAGGHGRVLRRAGIGWGRERYLPRIDALIAQEQEELERVLEEDRPRPPRPGPEGAGQLSLFDPVPGAEETSRSQTEGVGGALRVPTRVPTLARPRASAGARIERRIKEAQEARAFVVELLRVSSPVVGETIDVAGAARAASEFVKRFGVTRNEVDGMAKEGLTRLFDELAAVGTALRLDSGVALEVDMRRESSLRPSRTPAQARDDMRDRPDSAVRPAGHWNVRPLRSDIARRLAEAVRELHVAASNPRPGHLHVAPVRAGGWSARSRMFVVGLDDERHPGSGLQDPIILDSEREAIGIPIVGDRPQRITEEFRRLLERANKGDAADPSPLTPFPAHAGRGEEYKAGGTPALHRGGVTLSWATMSMKERRERFPSPALLGVYREATGNPNATFEEMTEKVAKENFVGPQPLAPSEWWLLRRFMDRDTNLRDAIHRAYPGLARGAEAENARDSSEITPWDGKINAPPELLDPRLNNRVYSASQLEKMASCPYQYFLDRILHVQPLEELQFEPDTWLEAHQFGTLLHSVLQKTMEELCASGQKPSLAFLRRMQEIAEEALADWRREIPPPSEAAFARRRTELIDSCEIFLRNEEVACGTVTPKYFELEFKNFRLPLGKGSSVELRGKIDRVDHDEAGDEWHVWDYKSGSTYSFDRGGQLQRGTKIQHAIYARAVEDKVGGRVTRSGYFFPTPKGNAARLPRDCSDQELKDALHLLFDTIRSGYFPHSDEDACRFCEFQQICGGAKLGADRTARKLASNAADPAVAAWLRLQDVK